MSTPLFSKNTFKSLGIAALVVLLAGGLFGSARLLSAADENSKVKAQEVVKAVYTCPMHPDVISDKPGKCPKCGMNLVLKNPAPKTDTQVTSNTQSTSSTQVMHGCCN